MLTVSTLLKLQGNFCKQPHTVYPRNFWLLAFVYLFQSRDCHKLADKRIKIINPSNYCYLLSQGERG